MRIDYRRRSLRREAPINRPVIVVHNIHLYSQCFAMSDDDFTTYILVVPNSYVHIRPVKVKKKHNYLSKRHRKTHWVGGKLAKINEIHKKNRDL